MKDGVEIGAVATAMISRYRDTRASHADRIRANTVILSFTTLRGSDAPPRPRSHAPTKCPPYAFNRNLDRSGLVNLHPTAGWKNGKEKKREISLPPPLPLPLLVGYNQERVFPSLVFLRETEVTSRKVNKWGGNNDEAIVCRVFCCAINRVYVRVMKGDFFPLLLSFLDLSNRSKYNNRFQCIYLRFLGWFFGKKMADLRHDSIEGCTVSVFRGESPNRN